MLNNQERTFIKSTQPQMLVTIAPRLFKRPMPDPVAIDYGNRLLKLVNTKLFKNRYKRQEQYLTGFAVLEHTYKGAPHLHAMITNKLDVDVVREAFESNAKRFTHQLDTAKPDDIQRIRRAHENDLPRFYLEALAKDCIREVPLYAQDAEGNGGIDVRAITKTSADYDRVIDYLQKEYRGFMLVTADGFLVNDPAGAARPIAA